MKRREFISLLGGAATWPLAARAQQPRKSPRIGIIDDSPRWNAFRHGLRDLGYGHLLPRACREGRALHTSIERFESLAGYTIDTHESFRELQACRRHFQLYV